MFKFFLVNLCFIISKSLKFVAVKNSDKRRCLIFKANIRLTIRYEASYF